MNAIIYPLLGLFCLTAVALACIHSEVKKIRKALEHSRRPL